VGTLAGGARWVYVWDARALKLPGLDPGTASRMRRGLLTWNGKGWDLAPKADGT
jgi:hypothetical protein